MFEEMLVSDVGGYGPVDHGCGTWEGMDYGCGRVVDDFEVVEEAGQWPTIA